MISIVMVYRLLFVFILREISALTLTHGDLTLRLNATPNGIAFEGFEANTSKLRGLIGRNVNFIDVHCLGETSCYVDDFNFGVSTVENGFKFVWTTNNTKRNFVDCYELGSNLQWYGGPTITKLTWPIQNVVLNGANPYVTSTYSGFTYVERYWLNSLGVYIFVSDVVPLYVDQNDRYENQLCFNANVDGPYFNRTRNVLEYYVMFKADPKEAHIDAVNKFLGKPKDHPNDKMISEPIWTTWAKYKTAINDSIVLKFAKEIRKFGYTKGQIEIDDNWERCYGSQEFSNKTFSKIKNTITELKGMNFRVTLWIHPFVNHDCEENARLGIKKDYFVKDKYGRIRGSWWNSNNSYQIDFTNPKAKRWWVNRVKKLKREFGFDSFKFDGGESDFSPQPAVYKSVDQELIPNILTGSYVGGCATFGDLIEVRSGWRTQNLPIFTRMLDKGSNWGDVNGLRNLLITLLQMNMVGFTMVLPDMIGGNGYNSQLPDAELFVRWTQANTFMPTMQFSYLPWDYNETKFDVAAISKRCVEIHEKYSSTIINAMNNSVRFGYPVNPPIWWIDTTDERALKCDDEFLVGDEILVAPVLDHRATHRQIYLPKGRWIDGNNNSNTHQGPVTLNYSADITVLPFFLLDRI